MFCCLCACLVGSVVVAVVLAPLVFVPFNVCLFQFDANIYMYILSTLPCMFTTLPCMFTTLPCMFTTLPCMFTTLRLSVKTTYPFTVKHIQAILCLQYDSYYHWCNPLSLTGRSKAGTTTAAIDLSSFILQPCLRSSGYSIVQFIWRLMPDRPASFHLGHLALPCN